MKRMIDMQNKIKAARRQSIMKSVEWYRKHAPDGALKKL